MRQKGLLPGMLLEKLPEKKPQDMEIERLNAEIAKVTFENEDLKRELALKDALIEQLKQVKADNKKESGQRGKGYGSRNKIFTKDRADAAKQRLLASFAKMDTEVDATNLADTSDIKPQPSEPQKSEILFNEHKWQQAKPHFEAAWAHFKASGKSIADLISELVEKFGEGIRPYVERFVRELPESEESPQSSHGEFTTPIEESIKVSPQPPETPQPRPYDASAERKRNAKGYWEGGPGPNYWKEARQKPAGWWASLVARLYTKDYSEESKPKTNQQTPEEE